MLTRRVGMFGEGITQGASVSSCQEFSIPPIHHQDFQFAADAEMVIEHQRQFTQSHAVSRRNRKLTNERGLLRFQDISRDSPYH